MRRRDFIAGLLSGTVATLIGAQPKQLGNPLYVVESTAHWGRPHFYEAWKDALRRTACHMEYRARGVRFVEVQLPGADKYRG